MAIMNDIASANGTMRVDTGRYASSLGELERSGYMESVPLRDAWGNGLEYILGDDTYTLRSLGSDGRRGPNPPADWTGPPYEPDIVLTFGAFTQAPGH